MPTNFYTGVSQECKTFVDGIGEREKRYVACNSRNANRKIIRSGAATAVQLLGIKAPTVAPTGTAGSGGNLFYRYVYVNQKFTDPLSLEPSTPYIRSNASPVLTLASAGGAPTNIHATVSADPQVTHIWLYVSSASDGEFVLISATVATYQVANTGTPTWANGVAAVPTGTDSLEIDNYVPDTCRMGVECNGFYNYAGFIAMTGNGSINTGASVVTITSGTMYDGVIALFFQFDGDSTGGPNGDGIHYANYISSSSLQLVDATGANRNYDGPGNKVDAPFRIFRDPSVIQISKRYNPDAIPGIIDVNYLIRGSGPVSGIFKPTTGLTLRYHYNNNGKKSVELVDFTQGVPPRRQPTNSPFSMANPRACSAAGGRNFYYDAQAGVIEDKGSTHLPMTLPVIPNLIRSLNKTSSAISEMEYDESRNLLFLAVAPTGYTKNYYLIVYNLTTNTWNLWFMLPDVLSMRRIADEVGNVYIYMGSSKGSVTQWPSLGFNEAVGNSLYGNLTMLDDSTHLTDTGAAFPTTGDKLIDRWIMTWNDSDDPPVYQFARISSNTATRLTLDTFIGPNSNSGFLPVPSVGDNYWIGPIQCILGPNWDYNSIPDEDGKVNDFSIVTDGQTSGEVSKLSLYRDLDTDPSITVPVVHNLYNDQSVDINHSSWKAGANGSIETTGITGWSLTDNNETAFSLKSIVKRIESISANMNKK